MSKIEEFNKIKGDTEKFKWLIDNQGFGLCLNLDNDDMFLVDTHDEDSDLGRFESWIGTSPGILDLLKAVGIEADYC